MSNVIDAICWNGGMPTVLLYTAWDRNIPARRLHLSQPIIKPNPEVYPFLLEDQYNIVSKHNIYVYDINMNKLPDEFEKILMSFMNGVIVEGASIAWLMYEGSFSFENIFAKELANSIYGVASSAKGQNCVTLDDLIIESQAWSNLIEWYRNYLFSCEK